MALLDFLLGKKPGEATPTARSAAQPITLAVGLTENHRLVARSKTRIAALEAKLARQREKGVPAQYIEETERELNRWRRQLAYSQAEVGEGR